MDLSLDGSPYLCDLGALERLDELLKFSDLGHGLLRDDKATISSAENARKITRSPNLSLRCVSPRSCVDSVCRDVTVTPPPQLECHSLHSTLSSRLLANARGRYLLHARTITSRTMSGGP